MKTLPFSDQEYGHILDSIVVACVDVAITYKGKVLLVKRTEHPVKDCWWLFGGRMIKGESPQATAKRGVYSELKLKINREERFREVGSFNLIWPTRREPISENGCHHLLVAHQIEINVLEKRYLDDFLGHDDNYAWFDASVVDEAELLPELQAILQRLIGISQHKPVRSQIKAWLR